MTLKENIREGINSIKANRLRTILTSAIIAIGITSLVGVLTAIDGIQSSINESFSNLGANTFSIRSWRNNRGSQDGLKQENHPPLRWDEVSLFVRKFGGQATPSVNAWLTFTAEVKYGSEITNPNVRVRAGDENFLAVEGIEIDLGRNFSTTEASGGINVALIGSKIRELLYRENENPVNSRISFLGTKFRVIGVLEEQGSIGGDSGSDRSIIIPIETARRLNSNDLDYRINMLVSNALDIELAMGEATGLMRQIRKDPIQAESSFEVRRSRSLAERLEEMSGYLRIGGFSIGLVTLAGASIALMNIMLVSVTERTREIGVRKALGATPKKIRQQFLIEALVICQLGGLAGIFLGLVIGNVVTSLTGGSFIIPWLWILLSILLGMVVGLISGYIPAYKASRLDPIESLRFE